MGDVLDFQEARIYKQLRSTQMQCPEVIEGLAETMIATGRPVRVTMVNSELPYSQSLFVGASYPERLYKQHEPDYQPWFLCVEVKYHTPAEIAAMDLVTRKVHDIEETKELLDLESYATNFIGLDQDTSPWFDYAFSYTAAMCYRYELEVISVGVTAENVMQVRLVGEDCLIQIDIEGPSLHACHELLFPPLETVPPLELAHV